MRQVDAQFNRFGYNAVQRKHYFLRLQKASLLQIRIGSFVINSCLS
ncbi:hypothetical protein OKW47_007766 [Paraburkholderia atlantica]